MTYFFLGWLSCLTIVVGSLFWKKKTAATFDIKSDTWTYTPASIASETATVTQKAEFLQSTRVDEIMKGKKDVKIDDILS